MRRIFAVVALSALVSVDAWAYVCSAVRECAPGDLDCVEPEIPKLTQAWNQRCVPVWFKQGDPLFEGRGDLIRRSFARWTRELDCTDMAVVFMGASSDGDGFDDRNPEGNTNLILSTQAPGVAVNEAGEEVLALARTSYSSQTGEIFDADIILNLARYDFQELAPGSCPSELTFDIENVLVHEVGHFFGLDHPPNPEATMYFRADACEVSKRTLHEDDIDGMCTIYADGAPTRTCRPPSSYRGSTGDPSIFRDQCARALDEGCGCRTGEPDGQLPPRLILVFVLMLGLSLRRLACADRARSRRSGADS